MPLQEHSVDELARANARANAARSRAIRLRRQADALASERSGSARGADLQTRGGGRFRRPGRPGRKAVGIAAALTFIGASFGVSGYLVWHHHDVVQERQRAAEFSAAARQAITTLMSIDSSTAKDDVQRVIDSTTGPAKAGMMMSAQDLIKAVEQSKLSTKVTVEGVAVESMTEDSAVVLVTAKSSVADPAEDKPKPRSWRLVATVQRDDGQLKLSKVEFLP